MLLVLLLTLVIFVPDAIDAQCSSLSILSANTNEKVIEKSKERNLDCHWTIESPDHVEINVTKWSLAQTCAEDSLRIYDGHDTHGLLLAELCSYGSIKIMVSSRGKAHVWFKTGSTSTGTGITLSYKSYGQNVPSCKPGYKLPQRRFVRADETHQVITSKNYPNNYPKDDKEEWVIIKPSASTPLAIVVEDMDIEDSHHCGYDYLAVYDGKCSYDKEKAKLCNDRKGSWTLTGNKYSLIRFQSDTDRTGKGFKLRFYLGTVEESKGDSSALHAILIGLIAACIVVIFLLASAKLYMRCFKKPKVRPNQDHLRNRRAVLEAQVRRGPLGSRLARMMTAQSIHSEMTRYLSNTTEHDSRVSTFEISTSQSSGAGLVFEDGMFQPPSYSTLFRHSEQPSAPPADTNAPPPYPGSPDFKLEDQGNTVSVAHASPIHDSNKASDGLTNVETVPPPPYNSS
ncbi:CUB and zona pellucida-like domain-containing protein 1 [Mytilus edulis]|uniref:CUB and zona pellucida-like domain-containing protein 1 n=1 Tax=Mytilus edulis TaxID=6550 RepID=UPI0039EEA6AB